MTEVHQAIVAVHREEWTRIVAGLVRRFGDLDVAEDAAAEAFAAAVERWPVDGVPPKPGAWLTTTANRRAIDRIRRESTRDRKYQEAQVIYDDTPPEPLGAIDDDRLRLMFITIAKYVSFLAKSLHVWVTWEVSFTASTVGPGRSPPESPTPVCVTVTR
ncbi:sigma factor [Gordonia bronchialis]|uniref:sigma factor n=1 Tax=Gordonia bronchialis TaxID=2054 RepID=UPI00311934FC